MCEEVPNTSVSLRQIIVMDLNTRKKRTPVIEESSSSADDEKLKDERVSGDDQIQTHTPRMVAPRSSERIQKKRNKKVHIPSKKEIWEKITPSKSPGKYDHLRPRKLVNNFTKENNRYNYDPNETSGEESLDDFIDDDDNCVNSSSDDSACGSNDEQTNKKIKKSVRIRGRHRRLRLGSQIEESSSSDSNDEQSVNEEINEKDCVNKSRRSLRLSSRMEHCGTYSHGNNDLHDVDHERDDKSSCFIGSIGSSERRNDMIDGNDENVSDASSGNNGFNLRTGRKRNRSVIESENDSDDSDIRVGTRNKHNRSVIESDSEDGDEETKNSNPENGNCTMDKVQFPKAVNSIAINESTDDSGIVGEPELKSVECNSFGSNIIETEPGTSRTGSNNEEKAHKICDVTNFVEGSSSTMNCSNDSDSSDATEGDSSGSESECDNGSSEHDDDLDEDIENSRIRVRKLRKKKEKEKLFDRFRMERQRKLSKSK